jgi:hypothetical protein
MGSVPLMRIAALDEKAVRVMPLGQRHTPNGYILRPETTNPDRIRFRVAVAHDRIGFRQWSQFEQWTR